MSEILLALKYGSDLPPPPASQPNESMSADASNDQRQTKQKGEKKSHTNGASDEPHTTSTSSSSASMQQNRVISQDDRPPASSPPPPSSPEATPQKIVTTTDVQGANATSSTKKRGPCGRKGDARMNKAVAAKLADPNLSLYDALVDAGGFIFRGDGKGDKDAYDVESHVSLAQRKNQLLRRLRKAKASKTNKKARTTPTTTPTKDVATPDHRSSGALAVSDAAAAAAAISSYIAGANELANASLLTAAAGGVYNYLDPLRLATAQYSSGSLAAAASATAALYNTNIGSGNAQNAVVDGIDFVASSIDRIRQTRPSGPP